MKYANIRRAVFLDRPNRFIANVLLDGVPVVCHVKNTGRCKELFLPGSTVYINESDNPMRKTKYDLIAVQKGDKLINADSQAPNIIFGEWVTDKVDKIKSECRYGNSRFDFYLEKGSRKIFAEIKGVTLEEDDVVRFPDAPTLRGLKHIHELIDCVEHGFEAWIVFVIQMEACKYFEPNRKTHPEFADALKLAQAHGVNIAALRCAVTPETLEIAENPKVEIRL